MTQLAETNRRRLREVALQQYGYFTTRDAADLDITHNEINALVQWGGIMRTAYGVYRFSYEDIPATGREGYMEAVLAVGRDAFLYADAVLALHDLALVNPARTRVGTPHRVRKGTLSPTIEVVRVSLPPEDLEVYEHIPTTTVARALLDCVGIVMTDRLLEAAADAADRGLLRRQDRDRVLAQLGGRGADR
jgi:predicted transcriptional regulator of viral defense system